MIPDGKSAEAEQKLQQRLARNKNDTESVLELARIYLRTERVTQAQHILSSLPPDHGLALKCLSCALGGQGAQAIKLAGFAADPREDPRLLHVLGYWLNQQGRFADSVNILAAALAGGGEDAGILHDYAIALQQTGKVADAIAQYQAAIRLDSQNPHLAFNLALALEQSDQLDEAMRQVGCVLRIMPGHLGALYRRSYLQRLLCEWRDYERDLAELSLAIEQHLDNSGPEMISPYGCNIHFADGVLHDRAAAFYARQIAQRVTRQQKPKSITAKQESDRLNIAYLSPDFKAHAVGGLISGLFACHDRRKFKVFAYSLAQGDDDIQQEIESGVDVYRDCTLVDPASIARIIKEDDIDILIDLAGYTRNARPEILAMHPAPLQVSFLGYLNTMQAPFVDALIADHEVISRAEEPAFSERVLRMPGCFLPATPRDTGASPGRSKLGLPEEEFVFCSFNHSYKIRPDVFELWMNILNSTTGSVLWILADRETVRSNLSAAVARAGIESDRLIFAERIPLAKHLARMQSADLCLDTPNYNGGATIIAAAQSGLPTLTLRGNRILGRMGSSLNKALGLDYLICDTMEQYLERACDLASKPALLDGVAERLREAVASKLSLQKYCANLEGLLLDEYRLTIAASRSRTE